MKVIFLFILFWSFSYNLHAQNEELIPAKFEMEVLRRNEDTTFVKVTSMKGQKLMSDESFYLIPETVKQPRYLPFLLFHAAVRLPIFYKKSYYIWISKHGLFKRYLEDGRSILTEYRNDQFKHQTFFYQNSEISMDDFSKMDKGPYYVIGVCNPGFRPLYEIVYDGKNYTIKTDTKMVLSPPAP